MHRERVQNIRNLMASYIGTDKINMRYFQQSNSEGDRFATLQEFHACGNTACFAGILAMSPEFRQQGGKCTMFGDPLFNNWTGADAVRSYLGIRRELANLLVSGKLNGPGHYCSFYEKQWEDVKAEDVVKKLDMILDGELE